MKKRTKLYLFFIVGLLLSCNDKSEKSQTIELSNDSSINLVDKAITIDKIKIDNPQNVEKFPLLITSSGDTIPSQVNGPIDSWDELFFTINLKPQEKKTLSVHWVATLPEFTKRTSARFGKRTAANTPVKPALSETMLANELPKSIGYQQYQTDGPSWENDKVGFRHYLDGRNAKDLFGKKTSAISPETVGIGVNGEVEDNYHVMEDWGRDILAVGNSVGIGGYALIDNDSLLRLGVTVNDSINNIEKTTFKIAEEGPVKSILEYKYTNWKPNNNTYSVEEKTTIWPGMYGYKNTVSIDGLKGNEILGVGLVNINNDKPLKVIDSNNKYVILYTHDQQSYEKEWWLGMALILPKSDYLGYIEAPKTGNLSGTFLAKLKITENNSISYYAIAGWELSDEKFIQESYFVSYLEQLAKQLETNITINIIN